MKTLCKAMLLTSMCLSSASALASEPVYSQNQIDALQVSVRTVFPDSVSTVGDAIRWYVEPLGYYVLTTHPAPTSAKAMLNRPIPEAAMIHRTMPVLHAIQLLIGQGNSIIVDKEHKLITVKQGV
ncbi:TPA: hypothetical protein ACVU5J_003941 [Vibrio parahaemolyticus]